MSRVPLAVLDLVPISTGSSAAEALRNSIDLAQAAERLGYARYWFAEHHLNPGVAGTSPAVVLALTAGATSTIRIGSGAVQMGHRTALSTVEEFGLIDALYPGRLDLGLGRSAGRPKNAGGGPGDSKKPPAEAYRTENGLLIEGPAATARCGVAELHRTGQRRAGAAARHVPERGRGGGAHRPRRGRRRAGLDPGQQRR
jgi:hypothetical protein